MKQDREIKLKRLVCTAHPTSLTKEDHIKRLTSHAIKQRQQQHSTIPFLFLVCNPKLVIEVPQSLWALVRVSER